MTPSLYADRSDRGKLRISGEKRLWFLDQILTQAFEDMAPGEARDAAMITVHGRMQGYLECVATGDAVLCHFEPELRAVLPEALSRYIFATPVEVDDVTDEMALVLVTGTVEPPEGVVAVHPTRSLGTEAAYLWLPPDRVGDAVDGLRASGASEASEDELERIRVANGVPRWGRDMDDKTFPQEAGVDALAVHYEKGCYLGQEAMAKIHFRGKVNRKLVRLQASGALAPGADVTVEGARVGRVTSAVDGIGLAMVKHTLEPGSTVDVETAQAEVLG